MNSKQGELIIGADTEFDGLIRGGERVEILGQATGSIATRHLVIHKGGMFSGSVKAITAEIMGRLHGNIVVRELMSVSSTGSVEGDVQYGQLQLERGGNLIAGVKNMPPELNGDFQLEVARGGTVAITPSDLHAVDPDNTPDELTYTAVNVLNGHLAWRDEPETAITKFTQADINHGTVLFIHNGSKGANAGFDVLLTDDGGAAAGPLQPVLVHIQS